MNTTDPLPNMPLPNLPESPTENLGTNWELVRKDFPILDQTLPQGAPLTYLDNAASSQMPLRVIEEISSYATSIHSNVHRGIHTLSQLATDKFEEARALAAQMIGAGSALSCVFVKGTTEAINLVAHGYGRAHLKRGDEIILTVMEHHANIVPWQQLAEERGINIRVADIFDDGTLNLDHYKSLFSSRTKLVGCIHVSNVLGTINPIHEIIDIAHKHKAVVMVDGCQAVAHFPVNVQELNADFYAFSAHKMYGPTGVGILYGKPSLLQKMKPFMGGGDMIDTVSFEKTTYKPPPYRFEAGTPPIISAIGLGAAIKYMNELGRPAITQRETELSVYLERRLSEVSNLTIIGKAQHRIGVYSFVVEGLHSHDVGAILDQCGVAVRVGRHCAEPLATRLGQLNTIRASLAFYNTHHEVDQLIEGLRTACDLLS